MTRSTSIALCLSLTLFAPGCAIGLASGVSGVNGPKIGGGTCTVVPGKVSGAPALESAGYKVDKKSWNQKLAEELNKELKDRGVTVGEGEALTISLVKFHYQTNKDTWAMESTIEVEVSYKDYSGRHKGWASHEGSSTQSAWFAAGAAISHLLKDKKFRAALTGK